MKNELIERTKLFALNCWKFCFKFPKSREYNAYVKPLIRSSSSIGVNYRASQIAKSTTDFINKLKIVEEEADESVYWLDIFEEITSEFKSELINLKNEGKELLAITVALINTAKKEPEEMTSKLLISNI